MRYNYPVIGNKAHSVKDLIIQLLSINKAMPLNRLISAVRSTRSSTSYHAVYLAVKELKYAGIIENSGEGFQITLEYIKGLKSFAAQLEDNYKEKPSLALKENSTIHMQFDSLNEATRFMAKAAYANIFDVIKNRRVFLSFQHLWAIQTIKNPEHMDIIKKLAKLNKWYAIVQGKTAFDKNLKNYYEKEFGANIRLGIRCAPISNTLVSGDIVAECFLPKKLIDMQEKVFINSTDFLSLAWLESYTRLCYNNKHKISVAITKNKVLAEQVKENIAKHFE